MLSEPLDNFTGFRRKSTLAVAIAALLILTPFSINNFFHGRLVLGAGSLAIVAILVFIAWNFSHGRYSSSFILLVLVPAIIFFLILAILRQGIIGCLWCYPALLSFYMMLPERKAWIANLALLGMVIPFAWISLQSMLAIRVTATLVAVSVFSAIFIRFITVQQQKLHELAIRDPLTGLLNRSMLDSVLDQSIQQNKRTGIPMTLLTIDIDHFKSINDAFGHEAGDRVLRETGKLLQNRVRGVDKVFRTGGEEFLIVLFGADRDNAMKVARELRKAVAESGAVESHNITISIGMAALCSGESQADWMRRSDRNLYRAKQAGRNRIMT